LAKCQGLKRSDWRKNMAPKLRTSLIIPSRNRPDLLAGALEAVLQSKRPPNEVIICDQSYRPHPTLGQPMEDRNCEIRYLWMETVGASQARNAGIAAARYEILAFVDDDVIVTPTWLEVMVQALIEHGPLTVGRGQILPLDEGAQGRFTPSIKIDPIPAIYEGRIKGDVLSGAAMALYRSAFDSVGGFDERLGAGGKFAAAEDNDLGFRLLEAGYRIFHLPDAIVRHIAWRTMDQYAGLCWNYGYGQGAYYVKHLSLKDRYMLGRMASDVAGRVLSCPGHLLRNRHQGLGDVSYILGMLKGGMSWLFQGSSEKPGR
jgi:GT2 family glycosyltransferase